jgi:prevent-host-death family protein
MNGVKVVPITDLRRNFGELTANLATGSDLVLTKDGRPFAVLKAAPEEKRRAMKELAGSLKGSILDDDALWAEVLRKRSRKNAIDL